MDHVEIRNKQAKRDERPKPVVGTTDLTANTHAGSNEVDTIWYDDEVQYDELARSDDSDKECAKYHGNCVKENDTAESENNDKVKTAWYDNELHEKQDDTNKRKVKTMAALFDNNCLYHRLDESQNYKETAAFYNQHDPKTVYQLWNKNVSNEAGNVRVDSTSICQINPHLRAIKPHKKDLRKEGHLYKQGGADRNKGWKKRWFIFDRKALKYFRDQKNSVSLRIIPVALMKSVTPDNYPQSRSSATDLFSIPGRQYQFTLECKHRTFLFGTDSIENCQQWQNSLMAAIIEYQKNCVPDTPYGGEMSSPDISGMVKFDSNRTKYFVVLKGKLLRYYHNLEDYAVDCPIHELSMACSSVKEAKKTTLHLDSSPDQRFLLNFDIEIEAIQWKTYIENAISRALGDDKVLNKVKEKKDNRVCADCNSCDAEWASINLGIVLCTKCAGPHRSLGVNRSKVRSLRMDNIFREKESIIQLLDEVGNKNANLFWYKNPDNNRVINEKTPDVIRQKHIEEKYIGKKFADLLKLSSKEELNMALYSAVKDGNIIAAMRALYSGGDINFMCPLQNKTVFDVANESDSVALKEFLEQNKNIEVEVTQGEIENEKLFLDSAKKTAIYHDGYLEKTGPNLRGFMKRWCVLHYGRITYFNEKNASEEKGSVDLADATSISVVSGQRQYSFDINLRAKNRTYRFAAPDETSKNEWLSCLIQVVSPFECNGYGYSLLAGYFYFKDQQTFWANVWLFLKGEELHIRHRDDPSIKKIALSKQMQCLQCNVGKHSEKSSDVITQLDSNHRIELITKEGHVLAYLQGMTLKDTRKMFSLLDGIVRGKS